MKYKYDLDVFYREDALSYYLLGVWMTDGNVFIQNGYGKCTITSKDRGWLEAIRNAICPELPVKKYKHYERYDIVFCSTELSNWLISKGCIPRKSTTLEYPKIPNKYICDFLRGVWDGDGAIFADGSECTIEGAAPNFIAGIYADLLKIIGLQSPKLVSRRLTKTNIVFHSGKQINIIPKHDMYRIRVRRRADIIKLLNALYPSGNCLSLKRKEQLAVKFSGERISV